MRLGVTALGSSWLSKNSQKWGNHQKNHQKDSDGLNPWQLLIQKYFEFLSGLVSWVGDVWIF